MEKRTIASLGTETSLLGFGLMRLPTLDGDSSKIDYPKAQAMVDRAYKAGVNYFDTAWPYHESMSEVFAGETLSRYPRESYYLATKMPTWSPFTCEEDMEKIFEKQLEKCKTSYFDFYLAHGMNEDRLDILQNWIYRFLCKKKEEGSIRRIGFSFHCRPDTMLKLVQKYQWDFAMIQLNYVDWDIANAKRLYEICMEYKLPVVIMESIKGGTLSNKLYKNALDVLKKADPAASPASWALRFAASLPNVITVLSGMSEPEHVEDNLKTFTPFKPLNDEERSVLEETAQAYRTSGTIPCTDCRYCSDCPAGVNIPQVLVRYNHYLINKLKINLISQTQTMPKSEQAHNCTACGQCVKLCPQGIDIPKYMKETADILAS